MNKKLLVLLPMLFLSQIFAQQLLSDVRSEILFPELTNYEKRTVAEQAQIILRDLYVNRFQKNYYYGEGYSFEDHVDPVEAITQVLNNIDHMTTEEMETVIHRIFVNQRDFHLSYSFPAPYSDYISYIPIFFKRTAEEGDPFQARVEWLLTDGRFSMSAPGQRVPQIGDRIVSYDGRSIDDAVKKLTQTSRGANDYGGFVSALNHMSVLSHRYQLVPENDRVEIVFQSALTDELYRVDFAWLTEYYGPSYDVPAENEELSSLENSHFTASEVSENIRYVEYLNFINSNKVVSNSFVPSYETSEPTLRWGIITKGSDRFGYLNIRSFMPSTGVDNTIAEIVRIVETHFKETVGLLIDVRNNGGGYLSYAEKLIQLFIPEDVDAVGARVINSELNQVIFNSVLYDIYPLLTDALNAVAGTDSIYSGTAPSTPAEEINRIGQIYYKPIGVLINAGSYSATDNFACLMQDNEAAVIYGEDPQSGGGGANTVPHRMFAEHGAPFEFLPEGHRMNFPWMQGQRYGHHEGMLIEDYGCHADVDVSPALSDLYNGGQTQMDKVLTGIKQQGVKMKSYVKVAGSADSLISFDSVPYFDITLAETEHVDLYIEGELVNRFTLYAYHQEMDYRVVLPSDIPDGKVLEISLIGKGSGNERLWNFRRKIIVNRK